MKQKFFFIENTHLLYDNNWLVSAKKSSFGNSFGFGQKPSKKKNPFSGTITIHQYGKVKTYIYLDQRVEAHTA